MGHRLSEGEIYMWNVARSAKQQHENMATERDSIQRR